MNFGRNAKVYDVVVVGGGPAGIGVSIVLRHAGIENFVVLERDVVGASFTAWPLRLDLSLHHFPAIQLGCLI